MDICLNNWTIDGKSGVDGRRCRITGVVEVEESVEVVY